MMILVDLALLTPVFGFLLWLYHYTRPRAGAWLDRAIAPAALLAAVITVLLVHQHNGAEGMARNVIAVTSAYLVGLAILAAGWLVRRRRHRLASARELSRPD